MCAEGFDDAVTKVEWFSAAIISHFTIWLNNVQILCWTSIVGNGDAPSCDLGT